MSKLKGFTSKLQRFALVLTLVGAASLFTFVAGPRDSRGLRNLPVEQTRLGPKVHLLLTIHLPPTGLRLPSPGPLGTCSPTKPILSVQSLPSC